MTSTEEKKLAIPMMEHASRVRSGYQIGYVTTIKSRWSRYLLGYRGESRHDRIVKLSASLGFHADQANRSNNQSVGWPLNVWPRNAFVEKVRKRVKRIKKDFLDEVRVIVKKFHLKSTIDATTRDFRPPHQQVAHLIKRTCICISNQSGLQRGGLLPAAVTCADPNYSVN